MTGSRRRSIAAAGALALALGLLASACSSTSSGSPQTTPNTTASNSSSIPASAFSDHTGITKTSVTVGNVSTLTAGLFEGAAVGTEAYADYVNSTGGVNGRKLVVDGFDDSFQGAGNAQATRSSVQQDFALVGGFSIEDSYGASFLATQPGVPAVGESISLTMNKLPNYFSAVPQQPGFQEGVLQYFKKQYPDATQALGTLIGNQPSDATSWAGDQYALTKTGYKVVYNSTYGITQTDFTANVIAMKSAGVKMILLDQMAENYAAAFLKDLTQQNFHPIVLLGAAAYTNNLVKDSGGAAAVDGYYLSQAYSLYLGQDAQQVPAVNTFLHWVQVASPSFKPDLFALYGWISGELFAQALRNAGSNPSRGSVLQALSKITTFNAQNLIAPTNPSARTISNCYILANIVNGNFQRLDDPAIQSSTNGFRCDYAFLSPRTAG